MHFLGDLTQLRTTGKLKRVDALARCHPLTLEQITHQLRLRIIQETLLLAEQLDAARLSHRSPPIIRRISRHDWLAAKNGRLDDPGALAVLVVPRPRIKKDELEDVKGSWRAPTFASLPHKVENAAPSIAPLCQDLVTSDGTFAPLYHGTALFPEASDRMRLRLALNYILELEFRKRGGYPNGARLVHQHDQSSALSKASDAYVLSGPVPTDQGVDTAPLVIALWRLRLWEGYGWNTRPWDTGSDGANPSPKTNPPLP